jgi:hypothetical protein
MDLQYVPALLTPAKRALANRMIAAIGEVAREACVNVFRRLDFMRGWHEVEKISFDRMVDPNDPTRLHDSDWTTIRLSQALKDQIVAAATKSQIDDDGLPKARPIAFNDSPRFQRSHNSVFSQNSWGKSNGTDTH